MQKHVIGIKIADNNPLFLFFEGLSIQSNEGQKLIKEKNINITVQNIDKKINICYCVVEEVQINDY